MLIEDKPPPGWGSWSLRATPGAGKAYVFQSGSWPRRRGLPTTMSKALARVTATLNLWKEEAVMSSKGLAPWKDSCHPQAYKPWGS